MNIAFVNISNHRSVSRGAGYIAGTLLREGFHVRYYDLIYLNTGQVAKKIIHGNFDILLISSMTIAFHNAIELIHIVKKHKNIPVMVGGVHATLVGEDLLKQYDEIDFLCIGEGESMIVDFLKNFKTQNYHLTKNLVYRKNSQIISNPLGPAEDLSKLPAFPWNYFRKDSIFNEDDFIIVASSRGCPYNCSYCSNGRYLDLYGKSYLRFRPVQQVIDEIKYLKNKYSPKGFFFGDEMLLSNNAHARSLLEAFKEQIDSPYGCMIRTEHINNDTVNLLKNSGCVYVGAGIECGNEEFRRKYLNRNMSNEQILHAFSLLRSAGIRTASFNIIGYPFDNDNELTEETVQFNKILSPGSVQFTIFYPFPGTALYERCISLDMIDQNKVKGLSDYYSDSILKGISLRQKLSDINSKFQNPYEIRKSFTAKYFLRLKSFMLFHLRKTYLLCFR
jgi:anaerobic magnesium-protoporphyrin IX monomethyl ester cyclase